MPKLSWSAFIELHPAAHLVAGVLPEGEATPDPRQALKLMTRLIAHLACKRCGTQRAYKPFHLARTLSAAGVMRRRLTRAEASGGGTGGD